MSGDILTLEYMLNCKVKINMLKYLDVKDVWE